jgi:hypothetical protein
MRAALQAGSSLFLGDRDFDKEEDHWERAHLVTTVQPNTWKVFTRITH